MKGMSKALSLLITITILTMSGAIVTFLASDRLGNFGRQTSGQGCIQQLNLKCQGDRKNTSLPASCIRNGNPIKAYKNEIADYTPLRKNGRPVSGSVASYDFSAGELVECP